MSHFQPTTESEVIDFLCEEQQVRIEGSGSQRSLRLPSPDGLPVLSLRSLQGIVSFSPADQVVTVRAGTSLDTLQDELALHGHCLPLGAPRLHSESSGTIGGAISQNLPHSHMGTFGSWREWVLGLRVVTSDGMVAKCGSGVVKNVAGYDIQRFLVGSRGWLAVILEATLRTLPLAALREPDWEGESEIAAQGTWLRCLPADIKEIINHYQGSVTGFSHAASLVALQGPWQSSGTLQVHRWSWGMADKNQDPIPPNMKSRMKCAKDALDPLHKLNPGAWGPDL